jgi:hypothetical protein
MANRTNLGMMLGEILAGSTNQNNLQRGYLDGMRGLEAGSQIELNKARLGDVNADADIKRQRLNYMTPEAIKRQAMQSLGLGEADEVPQDRMPDVYRSQASIENAIANENKSFDLAKQLSQIQKNNITANITPDNALDIATQVGALDGKMLDIMKNEMTKGIVKDGRPNANERGLMYSQGKSEFSNLGSDGTFNQITGASTINPQAIKPTETKPQWDSARGVFVSPDGGVIQPKLPDGSNLPSKEASKPLPATALKMQNEGLDKLTVARNIEKDLNEFGKLIDDGKLDFGIVSNLMNKAKNNLGMSDEESRNLASFQATMEKLRNDSLRLNTGVQTEGDAQRAWNELFTNINDPKLVRDRLNEIVSINRRAADLQKLNIDNIRANYNAEPLDYSQYEGMPTFKGESPTKTGGATSKQVKRTGRTKDGRRVVEYTDGTREFK